MYVCLFSFYTEEHECGNANLAPHLSYIMLSYSLSKSEKATVVFQIL